MAKEKNFENRVKRYMETVGAWGFKFFASGFTRSGIPDLHYCLRGRYIAIEVKAQDGEASVLQLVTMDKIRKAGGFGVILFPSGFDRFKDYIEKLDNISDYTHIPRVLK